MPCGGVACSYVLSPQHSSSPSARTPQLWFSPALTDRNAVFAGGLALPEVSSPQQRAVPSAARMPQACVGPALTLLNATPTGGVLWPDVSSPQQATPPSAARTP